MGAAQQKHSPSGVPKAKNPHRAPALLFNPREDIDEIGRIKLVFADSKKRSIIALSWYQACCRQAIRLNRPCMSDREMAAQWQSGDGSLPSPSSMADYRRRLIKANVMRRVRVGDKMGCAFDSLEARCNAQGDGKFFDRRREKRLQQQRDASTKCRRKKQAQLWVKRKAERDALRKKAQAAHEPASKIPDIWNLPVTESATEDASGPVAHDSQNASSRQDSRVEISSQSLGADQKGEIEISTASPELCEGEARPSGGIVDSKKSTGQQGDAGQRFLNSPFAMHVSAAIAAKMSAQIDEDEPQETQKPEHKPTHKPVHQKPVTEKIDEVEAERIAAPKVHLCRAIKDTGVAGYKALMTALKAELGCVPNLWPKSLATAGFSLWAVEMAVRMHHHDPHPPGYYKCTQEAYVIGIARNVSRRDAKRLSSLSDY